MTLTGTGDPRYPHFMLKEIYEQPSALKNAVDHYLPREAQRKTLEDVRLSNDEIRRLRKINLIASGASRHACLAGEFMIERLAAIPVEVDHASQYCYRDPITLPGELTVLLSQSGTTADTLAALHEAKAKGAKTLAICNVPGSPLTQESDGNIYTHAGKEVSIAATKSFTSQLVALYALALHFGNVRQTITPEQVRAGMESMTALPSLVEHALDCDAACRTLADELYGFDAFMYLGRDISYPIALEGALKLKETCYIHAEGYPTGEMKHGPNALVDENLPVVMIATADRGDAGSMLRYEKSISNLRELRGRSRVIVVCERNDREVPQLTSDTLRVDATDSLLSPVLEIVPLQLLAYHMAVRRGVDVDRPRNLSKSVTIE